MQEFGRLGIDKKQGIITSCIVPGVMAKTGMETAEIVKGIVKETMPDVLAKMPFDAFDEIADYAKAPEIAEIGRALMKEALDKYEASLD